MGHWYLQKQAMLKTTTSARSQKLCPKSILQIHIYSYQIAINLFCENIAAVVSVSWSTSIQWIMRLWGFKQCMISFTISSIDLKYAGRVFLASICQFKWLCPNLCETVIKLHYMLRPWSDKGTFSSSVSSVNYVLLIYWHRYSSLLPGNARIYTCVLKFGY